MFTPPDPPNRPPRIYRTPSFSLIRTACQSSHTGERIRRGHVTCGRVPVRSRNCGRADEAPHGIFQAKTRNQKCSPLPEKLVPRPDGLQCRCPVAHPEEPARVHIIHEREEESPAHREGAGDVYREIRVPGRGRKTDRTRAGHVRLRRRLPVWHRCCHLEHGKHRSAPREGPAPPGYGFVCRDSEVP